MSRLYQQALSPKEQEGGEPPNARLHVSMPTSGRFRGRAIGVRTFFEFPSSLSTQEADLSKDLSGRVAAWHLKASAPNHESSFLQVL